AGGTGCQRGPAVFGPRTSGAPRPASPRRRARADRPPDAGSGTLATAWGRASDVHSRGCRAWPRRAGCYPATVRAGRPAENRRAGAPWPARPVTIVVSLGKDAGQRVSIALVDELAHGPEELRVQVPAAHAVQPPGTAGEHVRRVAHQREPPVLAADRDRHYAQSYQDGQEESGCYYDYETGHDGLQHFRPALHPRGPTRCNLVRRVSAGLVLAGHGVPVCPRSVRALR